MRLSDFRHHVLALLLVSDQFCASASTMLQPRFFETTSEQHLTRFVLEYYREYHKPPKKMAIREKAYAYFNTSKHLKNQLEEFDVLLDVVCDLDESAAQQKEYIQNQVREFCKSEAMKDAMMKSVDDIQAGKFDEVLARIQKAMSVGAEMDGMGTFLLADADNRKTVEESRRVVKSGQKWLDEPTKGGIARGELFILMAPPNKGKTSSLINIGTGVMKNRGKVLHVTLEMNKEVTAAKYSQCLLRKSDSQLASYDDEAKEKIATWMKKLRKNVAADVYVMGFPPGRLTIDGLRAHCMLLKTRFGFVPDMIIIDYMDLMAMPTHIKEEHLKLAWLGIELRALGIELDAAIATATQTNRGGATKETAMEDDIAGDFTKVATSDFLASLNQNKKETEEDMARYFWIKNRFGMKYKTYNVLTDFERTLISPA